MRGMIRAVDGAGESHDRVALRKVRTIASPRGFNKLSRVSGAIVFLGPLLACRADPQVNGDATMKALIYEESGKVSVHSLVGASIKEPTDVVARIARR